MARYQKGTVNNDWDADQDGRDETPTRVSQDPTYLVLCWSSEGNCLNAKSYKSTERELAQLAFDMNKAALTANPSLLPNGTTHVVFKEGNRILDFAKSTEDDFDLIRWAS